MMLHNSSWKDLCTAVSSRFEKDQHNFLVRQFYNIKQTGSVTEYIEHFDDLVQQLRAHDPTFSQVMITNRFVDGLKYDTKAVVMIQKPLDLDTASSLACLQEELQSDVVKREPRKADNSYSFRSAPRNSGISNVPAVKSPTYGSPEEQKHAESLQVQTVEEKLAAIKAFRRAKGLCY